MAEVWIVGAARLPVGTFGGTLAGMPAVELGAAAVREALKRAGVGPEEVEEVFLGNVLQGGQGQGPARQASLRAGIPVDVPATTVNMVCGSGLKAVALGTQAIALGEASVVVAGGMESMSQAPYLLPKARFGYRMGTDELVDGMIKDGLWCALANVHMGITAENLAEKYGISREEQDEFAAASQQKAERAIKEGRFAEEIVPIAVPQRKGEPLVFQQDEHPRFGTTKETLAKLRPSFKEGGTVTAGNSSGINDGAAAVVLMSADGARRRGLKPLGRVISYAWAGVEPSIMGIGPVPAVRRVLARAGMTLEEVGLVELNEAFAAQSLAVIRQLELDVSRVNPNGGAIALGHPIGASGARLLVTLLYEMKRRDVPRGLVSLCIGGGMGIAMTIGRDG